MITIEPSKGSNVKIYEYGIRVDKECLQDVNDQIIKARRLYNDLVACIQAILAEQQKFILDKAGDEAWGLNDEINALTTQFLSARANQDEEAMKLIATERHQKRVSLWGKLGDTRKTFKKELQEKFISKIGLRSECDTYKLRSAAVANGLGWATAT